MIMAFRLRLPVTTLSVLLVALAATQQGATAHRRGFASSSTSLPFHRFAPRLSSQTAGSPRQRLKADYGLDFLEGDDGDDLQKVTPCSVPVGFVVHQQGRMMMCVH